ncbi:hypothetical protein DFJ73DRAFT_889012 [Zopfochytrium polystomum]|nr:hypothetical protein DFJ73DRAFT_889012 [Zopfochytrium polystomum]
MMSTTSTADAGAVSALTDFKASLQRGNAAAALAAFAPSATSILCVPSGAAAGGGGGASSSLMPFLKAMAAQNAETTYKEQLISQATTSSSVFEEAVVTVVHNSIIDWLLPNVKPTNRRIVFPLVTVAQLAPSGKIQSLHLHWDQGTVLRQIGVLPNSLFCKANNSETVLPVLGPKVADPLLESASAEQNASIASVTSPTESVSSSSFGKPSQVSDIFSGQAAPASRPSTRVHQRPGGKSHDIFGTEKMAAALNESRTVDDAAETESVTSEGASSVTSGTGGGGRRRGPASAMASSLVFGDDGRIPVKSLGLGGRRDPNAPSSEFGERPSSRVLRPPGGTSSIRFG